MREIASILFGLLYTLYIVPFMVLSISIDMLRKIVDVVNIGLNFYIVELGDCCIDLKERIEDDTSN